MWGSIPSCLRRHKKKLLFLGGVVGGIAILNTYLKRKLLDWESKRTTEICDQLKRAGHFDGTMQTCDSVYLSCTHKIRQVVRKTIDVNGTIQELNTNPANKIQLWEQLKELIFSESLGEMYAQCLLCILLRVQMSILSGYIFTSRCTNSIATEQQQKYLSRIEEFILNGIPQLLSRVRRAVSEHVKPFSLNKPMKLQDIEKMLFSLQNSIMYSDCNFFQDLSCYLNPASTSDAVSDEFLDSITLETRDVIECKDFSLVFQQCINCGTSALMDRMSECFVVLADAKDGFINPHDHVALLAKLLPIVHNVYVQHKPDEQGSLVHSLLQLDSLNNFAANIYEAFSQKSN